MRAFVSLQSANATSLLILAVLLVLGAPVQAQLVLNGTQTPQQLVQNMLVGPGVVVSNVEFNFVLGNTVNSQIAGFNATGTTMGLDEGVLLCTGDVEVALGPNDMEDASLTTEDNFISDVDLDALAIDLVFEPAILEFDFVATGDSIKFQYVFASEEYLEYVDTEFNDVFGFFLSGPGITGPYTGNAVNLAVVPGTTDVVSVNTINNVTNSGFYIDNGTGFEPPYNGSDTYIQFDGFTTPLTARSAVQCGETYHIKLAICDVGDPEWDSGIFLIRNSFGATPSANITIEVPDPSGTLVEGCGEALVTITRSGTSGALVVPLSYSGSALAADLTALPTSVTIPAGSSSVQFSLSALLDGLSEGSEQLVVEAGLTSPCSGGALISATLDIADATGLEVSIAPPMLDCNIGSYTLTAAGSGGGGDLTYAWSNGTVGSSIQVAAISASYTVTVTDACGATATATVQVDPGASTITVSIAPPVVDCETGTATLTAAALGGSGTYTYTWSTGATGASTQVPVDGATHTVNVADDCGGSASATVEVVVPSGNVSVVIAPAVVDCANGTAQLTAVANGGGGVYTFAWSTGQIGNTVQVEANIGSISVSATDACGATGSASTTVTAPANFSLGGDTIICAGTAAELSTGQEGLPHLWNTGSVAASILVEEAGTYTVTVEDGDCITRDTIIVLLYAPLRATPMALCSGETGYVTWDEVPASVSWWDGGTQVQRAFDVPGTYGYTLVDPRGCQTVDSLSVAMMEDDLPYIPNAFTPNGDGVNDSWSVAGQVPLTTRLTVFDRWGGEMHTSNAGELLWNGDVRGAPAPDGVYVYRFVYRSECVQGERAVLGHVTLLR